MRYLMAIALSMAGCPGDECKTDADCGKDEYCTEIRSDARTAYNGCLTQGTKEGDSSGGFTVTKIEIGPAPSVTLERAK